MKPLRARVIDGRLVLEDAVTDLPEGMRVELVLLADVDVAPAERQALLEALDEADADVESGDTADGFEFVARLRERRASANR